MCCKNKILLLKINLQFDMVQNIKDVNFIIIIICTCNFVCFRGPYFLTYEIFVMFSYIYIFFLHHVVVLQLFYISRCKLK